MAISRTPQDDETALALAEALAEADGLGEAFRRSAPFAIDGVWIRYSAKAHDVMSAANLLGWVLKRS